MKRYLVIGNPIKHSLSPKLHNYWFMQNNIDAVYEKQQINENEIKFPLIELAKGRVDGINVTVPFKNKIIPFLDELEYFAKKTQSVNTIYKKKDKIIGTNTDVIGFDYALRHIKYSAEGKKIFILGAGGVTPSIIFALERMQPSTIMLSNRTKEKAENLKKLFPYLELVKWGDVKNFDMIVNATSLGLKENDRIPINYDQIGSGKFFYDVIYNPKKTNFLSEAEKHGHQIENGKMMFIYQANKAFEIWTGIQPPTNKKVIQLLEND